MNIEPGLFELAIEDYHRDPCPEPSLNNSLIEYLLQCPAKARVRHPRLNPTWRPDDSRRADLGSVAHKLLLGRGRDVAIIDADSYRTNAAKEQRDAARAGGFIPVLIADLATAEAMHTACIRQLTDFGLADAFEGGKSELALLWKDIAGCWGRSLIDRLRDDLPLWEIWDYKTTDRSARPEESAMGALITDQGYDTQFAMQERGLFTLFPSLAGRLKFRLLFQETEEPYLISVVEPDAATMAIARRKVDYALALWADCLQNESWPGYTPGIVTTKHNEFLANRWLTREIEESEEVEEVEPEPVKRGPGRPYGSKNVPKKRLLFERRQAEIAKREAEREKQNPMEGG